MQTLRQIKVSNLQNDNPFSDSQHVQWCSDQSERRHECRTQTVVFLISCRKCGKQYVWETKGTLNIRMNGHRNDWRHKGFERSPVGEHFCSSGHDFFSHASVCCSESNPEWTDNARKSRESYWIRRLITLIPSSINKETNL